MHPTIRALLRVPKGIFGSVWGVRVVHLLLAAYFVPTMITNHGCERLFAAGGMLFWLSEIAFIEWDRAHPRPQRRRAVSEPFEADQGRPMLTDSTHDAARHK